MKLDLKSLNFLLPRLEEQIDAEGFQQLGSFDEGAQVLPAVPAQGVRALAHRLVEREHGEGSSGLWFPQQVLSRLLLKRRVAARSNLRTQLTVKVHVSVVKLPAGIVRRFTGSGTVLHDCPTDQHTRCALSNFNEEVWLSNKLMRK